MASKEIHLEEKQQLWFSELLTGLGFVFLNRGGCPTWTLYVVLLRNEGKCTPGQEQGFWSKLRLWCLQAISCHSCCGSLTAQPALDVSLFSPALPAQKHEEAPSEKPLQTPSSQIFAPLGMFPALWFYQLSGCLVCLDEKVGNMPKHPIALGLIFALSTVSGPDFHSICLWLLLDN